MAITPTDDVSADVEQFLTSRGHEVAEEWVRDLNKKQCPDCYCLHALDARECTVCGWKPGD